MSHPACYPAPDPSALWLLVPPAPVTIPRPAQSEAGTLELLVAITGAPEAILPELWNAPVHPLEFTEVRTLLQQICTALAKRIPFLHFDFLEWEDDSDSLLHCLHIPVDPVGIDSCNGEVVGYGTVVAWVAALSGYMTDDLPYPLPEEMPQGFEVWDLAPDIAKRYQGQPLAGLADVIDLLSHDTGTFFLDACPACWYAYADENFTWTDDNIAWLEQDAARALTILERIGALEAWVQADPARIGLVWQALVAAYADMQAEPVTTPQTLMEVWDLVSDENSGIDAEAGGERAQEDGP
jgi:hypothetical protein